MLGDDDFKVFFDSRDFAGCAIAFLPDGSRAEIPAIFDNAFVNPQNGTISLDTTDPVITCPADKVEELREALRAGNAGSDILDGQTEPLVGLRMRLSSAPRREYTVLQVRPDGTGVTVIGLAIA